MSALRFADLQNFHHHTTTLRLEYVAPDTTLAMGGRQIRPARVLHTVSEELNHNILGQKAVPTPPWFSIMQSVPPSETLVRTIPPRHRAPNPKATKPKNLFRPQRISYPEDALRTTFYKDHPWELARPRIILELDGKDYQHCDWSKGLKQNGIPLVVQRQMWLMENDKLSKRKAYDITRREFYRLRQEEEIEKRVALEEAKHVGAYFGKTRIDVGHILEDKEFENWKIWAGKETERQEAMRSSEIESFGLEEEGAAEETVDADAAATEAKAA
ncbi:37S ribosomal S25 mitochondrial [Fusarium albosuccineum]|uniref:Small ribosomal subunit protein mS23 n=1 Tax=Fusarium albosuccineum TaxID=1237068 RepID=A0A8H4PHW3_9HYPO|nr:37S ribosomal S25 mitochondrial [Fusarium albosuccineum]